MSNPRAGAHDRSGDARNTEGRTRRPRPDREDIDVASTFEGRTVDEAVEEGLIALECTKSQVDIVVLDKGSKGFLGLGSRRAKVRLEPKAKVASTVRAMTGEVLRLMGIEASVSAHQRGRRVGVRIESGDSDGLLIGRKGETLNALEHILNRMTARQTGMGDAARIELDVADYRRRREEQLRKSAEELAERVARSGRRAMTEPLPPEERRIVHDALSTNKAVETHAAGQGFTQRVVVTTPRRQRKQSG